MEALGGVFGAVVGQSGTDLHHGLSFAFFHVGQHRHRGVNVAEIVDFGNAFESVGLGVVEG